MPLNSLIVLALAIERIAFAIPGLPGNNRLVFNPKFQTYDRYASLSSNA
jgi:hypothetical protein